ncbi:MAG: ABC transporter permease [Pseudomonadota bacterium]
METIFQLLDLTIRSAVPLLLACLAGLYSERSGIVDIGLEGKMLGGAFAAAAAAAVTGSAWVGLLAGMSVAILLSLIHGFASITNKGNQIVSGVAINFIAAGLSALLGQAWFNQGGRTPQLQADGRFNPLDLPLAETLSAIPFLGPLYKEVLSGHNLLAYVAFAMVPITWWVLFRTRFGLRLRAVGENPAAVDTAGISVAWARYRAVIICGALCGLAGAYLSIGVSAGFVKDMTAGRGFIALAALIFAKWRPVAAMWTCLLFGFLGALEIRYQGVALPMVGVVPIQLVQALPYILTVILLAGFIGRAIPPKAGGVPYLKER